MADNLFKTDMPRPRRNPAKKISGTRHRQARPSSRTQGVNVDRPCIGQAREKAANEKKVHGIREGTGTKHAVFHFTRSEEWDSFRATGVRLAAS